MCVDVFVVNIYVDIYKASLYDTCKPNNRLYNTSIAVNRSADDGNMGEIHTN